MTVKSNVGSLFYGHLLHLGLIRDAEESSKTNAAGECALHAYPFPGGEPVAILCERMLVEAFGPGPHRGNQVRSDGSFALIRDSGLGLKHDVVGFARLQPSAKDPKGATWGMISSLLVRPKGCGLGRTLLSLMEAEALRQGFTYSCVWTDDDSSVTGFYQKCGYAESEPASASSSVLNSNKLSLGALNKLFQSRTPANGQRCMRKRLVVKRVTTQSRADETTEMEHAMSELSIMYGADASKWSVVVRAVSWERQIGPCCGLAALRMTGRYFQPTWEDETDQLMKTAIDQGFSKDGEIFDINHLALLGERVTGLKHQVRRFTDLVNSPNEVLSSPESFSKQNCLVILPYDKGSGSGYPELRSGLFAHYGIIVGVAQSDERIVYFVRHGASSKLIGATKEDWIASNAQLVKRDTVRYKDETEAIDLAHQCVVVFMQ